MTTVYYGDVYVAVTCDIDLCFIVDSSGSIGPDNWNRVLNFVGNVIDSKILNTIFLNFL